MQLLIKTVQYAIYQPTFYQTQPKNDQVCIQFSHYRAIIQTLIHHKTDTNTNLLMEIPSLQLAFKFF